MNHPSRVGKEEGEPAQLKVSTPGKKSVELVTSKTLDVGQFVSRRIHAFGVRAQCLWQLDYMGFKGAVRREAEEGRQ